MLLGCGRDAVTNVDSSLLYGKWRIASVAPVGASVGTDTGNATTNNKFVMELTSQFTASYSLEVNSCSASFSVPEAGRIRFENLGCTKVCCDPPLGNTTGALLPSLTYFAISNDTLFLSGAPHHSDRPNLAGEIVLVRAK